MRMLEVNIPMYSISDNKYFIDATRETISSESIHPMCKLKKNMITTKNNQIYYLLRYDKNTLIKDLIPVIGLFKCVILNKEKNVVSFSPPKTIPCENFIKMYPAIDNGIQCEEFVEGTMINIFWDKCIGLTGAWEISTRNTVGEEITFVKNLEKSTRELFLDACSKCLLDLNSLERNYCYSFVVQHPENNMVIPIKYPSLYLVEVYKIVIDTVFPQSRDVIQSLLKGTNVKVPQLYDCNSYSDAIDSFASMNTNYKIMGIVIKNIFTGERCKIRNPSYEEVLQMRGTQSKLQYQYLSLRKEGKVADYIKYYPEHKDFFSLFRDQIHLFTETLYKNYVSCYIKKETLLKDFSPQYRYHMCNLHKIYISEYKQKKQHVNLSAVINYINELDPSQIMYYLNYNMHKRVVDYEIM